MKMGSALILKFIMITVVLWIVLGLFGVSLTNILLISIVLTIVSLIGDMVVFPKVGNVSATIGDFVLSLVVIWLMGSFLFAESVPLGMAAFVSAIIISVGEFVFHKYLQKSFFTKEKAVPEKNFKSYPENNMQTEFGSEVDVKKRVEDKPKNKNPIHRPKKRKKKNPY